MEQAPHQNTTFPSGGGQAHGYLALPEAGYGPGVIVVQEWWGLTDHIKDVADRLAAEGFVALAPDLYGGKVAHDADEARRMMKRLPEAEAARLLSGAVDFLLHHEAVTGSTVGAIGFCMGGGFVLALAAEQGERIGAAVPFYGVGQGVPDAYHAVSACVQGHYGRQDRAYPVAKAQALEEQIRRESSAPVVEFHYYDAPHAFHNDENPRNYRPGDARAAWDRAVAFLREHVG
ncbi:carboxymethylenebutenolidase [Kocuria dechangensis]|uniref:Carboxymethylenebutenolidase n=1 Tax=Kocuria dechangensis TaxID=1176249 RepID=A0A917H920_9MICC|nr:dienelactone hydrolase family protein [Kocuria dechangensis]GGG70671.1 carboxymethylenebutenolidase [Kocuria dechangensis]